MDKDCSIFHIGVTDTGLHVIIEEKSEIPDIKIEYKDYYASKLVDIMDMLLSAGYSWQLCQELSHLYNSKGYSWLREQVRNIRGRFLC
jgi:hypothetical protein